jgi:hypothetical protein
MKKIIIGAALAAIAAAVTFTAPAPAASAAAKPVVYGVHCFTNWCHPEVRPHGTERWIFGAGNQYITRMSWDHWNMTDAYGHGRIHICPSSSGCTRHRTSMYLHWVRSHNGRKYFKKLTLRWKGHVQRLTYAKHGGTAVTWG